MYAYDTPGLVDVQTVAGTVRGFWRESSAAFLGIPYAAAPVGQRRFAAPVPHPPWQGVRDAGSYGPTPQRTALAEVTLIPEPSIPGDSTLSVNVFTPHPEQATTGGLPVLVYIHGGGFVAGSPISPWYDGAAFNRDDVVVVTVSYRLGFDGFGWISDVPHNRGVLDWLLALEWVQENIASFGGDPARVTISGQSAGGGAVLTLLGMPRAQTLFSRAYSISGATADVPLDQAEDFGRRLAELGGAIPTRSGLSQLSETRILDLQRQLVPMGPSDGDPVAGLADLVEGGLRLGPVVDEELIPRATIDSIGQGVGADKDLILGATDHEFNMLLAGAHEALAAVPAAAILARLGVNEATAHAYISEHPGLDTASILGQYATDKTFRITTIDLAEARGGAATWLYRFAWRSPVFGEAVHCLDVPFFFDCLAADRVSAIAGGSPPQQLADDVHGAAVSFIHKGDPGWPAWTTDEPATRIFDTPSSVADDGYSDVRSLRPVASR